MPESKLYFAFINPHTLYGIQVYGYASSTALGRLYKLKNLLLRILLRKRVASPVKDYILVLILFQFFNYCLKLIYLYLFTNVFIINVICQVFFVNIFQKTQTYMIIRRDFTCSLRILLAYYILVPAVMPDFGIMECSDARLLHKLKLINSLSVLKRVFIDI